MEPTLTAVFVGEPQMLEDEHGAWQSSIWRSPASGPVDVTANGLQGDRVTQSYHGSPGAAVCVHLLDHYRFWNSEYGTALATGAVGENFTLDGITEDAVCAGDIVLVGTSLLQVSGPRVPCANLARHLQRPDWVRNTIRENRTGFYLRVLEPGTVCAGDRWLLRERPNPDGSIPAINQCMYLAFDPEAARRFMGMRGLAEYWKELFREKLTNEEHWTETLRQ